MIKKLSLVSIILFFALAAMAQERYFDERYTYTQHFIHPVLINPGATGQGDAELIFSYRNKWATFPGSPKTLSLSYDSSLGNRLGFGAILLSDSNGALETTKGQVAFSYTIDSPTNKLGFGLSTELIQHKVGEFSSMVDLADPDVLNRINGNTYFDVSFGVYGLYNNQVKYGIALPSLISSSLASGNTGASSSAREMGFIFHLGYDYQLSDSDVHVEPSIFVKKLMFVPTHVDINLKATFLEDRLTGGLTYGVGAENRLGFLIGTQVRNLDLYYSYNVSGREFQDYNNGSHDLSLAINLSKSLQKETEAVSMSGEKEMIK